MRGGEKEGGREIEAAEKEIGERERDGGEKGKRGERG